MYDIGQYAKVGGPERLPLSDAYVEIYSRRQSADQCRRRRAQHAAGPRRAADLRRRCTAAPITSMPAPSIRSATNGTTGDGVGDYELFVRDVTGRPTALHALLRRSKPAALDRLGHPGRPHLAQPRRRQRPAGHRQRLHRRRLQPLSASRARTSSPSISPRPATSSSRGSDQPGPDHDDGRQGHAGLGEGRLPQRASSITRRSPTWSSSRSTTAPRPTSRSSPTMARRAPAPRCSAG